MNKIIIIDGYSLLFRAYFATYNQDKSKLMRTQTGIPTNAIFGFSNVIARFLNELKDGDSIFVALDSSKKTFRHKLYKDYKANRKPMDEELKVQLPIVRELLDSLNIPHFESEDIEGDDIAGNIAKKMEKENFKVLLFTSDKDYLQLIDENISVELIKKGLKNIKEMTPTSFYEEWGFEPIKIIDYKALCGDESDNIKGIKGIGDKTAKSLIIQYGDFENIIKNANTNTKVGQNLIEYEEQGKLSKYLATIKVDDEIPLNKEDLIYKGYEFNKISDFCSKYELKYLVSKLPTDFRIQTNNLNKIKYKEVDNFKNIDLSGYFSIGIDVNSDNYHFATLFGVSIYTKGMIYYISEENLVKDNYLKACLNSSSIKKYCFDYKKIKCVLSLYNISINGLEFDLLLSSYLLNSSLNNDIGSILSNNGIDISYALNEENSLFGSPLLASISAYYSYELAYENIEKLKINDQYDLFKNIELPLSDVLADIEIEGFPVNKDYLFKMKKDYLNKLEDLSSKIIHLNNNEEFNINSPKQLAVVLYDNLKLDNGKSRSTSAENLIKLYDSHPIIPLILEYRKYSKIVSTYIDGFIPFIDDNGLVHTTFNQALTQTGRLSSSEPNLQNISTRDEETKLIRKAFFYNDPTLNIISLDYSQIELRVLAHLSNSSSLINAFNNNLDIHKETAKKVFHLDREPTDLERRKAKTVNFGIIYGISDWGLSEQLHCSVQEAKDLIETFNNEFPEIKKYFDDVIQFASYNNYVKTMFNRRRYFLNLNSNDYQIKEFEKRAAKNAPIQGSAADLIKIAMIEVNKELKNRNFKAKIINQIHDEILIKVDDSEKDEVFKVVKNIMENCVKLKVILKVDGGSAKNWYDAK